MAQASATIKLAHYLTTRVTLGLLLIRKTVADTSDQNRRASKQARALESRYINHPALHEGDGSAFCITQSGACRQTSWSLGPRRDNLRVRCDGPVRGWPPMYLLLVDQGPGQKRTGKLREKAWLLEFACRRVAAAPTGYHHRDSIVTCRKTEGEFSLPSSVKPDSSPQAILARNLVTKGAGVKKLLVAFGGWPHRRHGQLGLVYFYSATGALCRHLPRDGIARSLCYEVAQK
ncbi:hypothetical protein CCM_06522 [Cordyceps militaris CM01]|uniref:Uncharacterized protein n=1 Tax=Cordyceps militaris (strain CM01) TaxID=983644 RepID=G3JMS0_CORMM|nr:uncharacterized protein CCM_06522 [Cordyceps militaris CM01]EGX90102.1 hypothetical protein CCM_06522 [Cordyceps militaris CM01]